MDVVVNTNWGVTDVNIVVGVGVHLAVLKTVPISSA